MKKHLIAAAVAGALAVPAMAQVTIKGTFDVQAYGTGEVETQATTTATKIKTDTNSTASENGWATSEMRVEGEEDLGGGLKASFALATGISGGASTFADRDRFIALSGGFGTFRMGRINPAASTGYHGTVAGTTNQAGELYTLATASSTNAANFGGSMAAGNFERSGSKTIQFTTPSMGGFVANLNYSTDSSDKSDLAGEAKATQTGVHIGYSAGPLSIGVATSKRDVDAQVVAEVAAVAGNAGTAAVAQTAKEGKLTWFAGSYDLGMAKVGVARIMREDETTTAARVTTKNGDISINAIQVTVPMGAITARASYYAGENDVTAATTDDLDLKGYQVSLNYALSKRTSAYFAMGQNKTERAGTNTGAVRERTSTGLGLTHSF